MKNFSKYTLTELRLIAKSWNHHTKIDYETMKKPELRKALEEKLEHSDKGEIRMKAMKHNLPIVEGEAEKYVKTNPDSSIKLYIHRLVKHYHKKYVLSKAEEKATREFDKLYQKHKGKKAVNKINEAIIHDIEEITEEKRGGTEEKKEKKPVGRPKKKKE
jgi:hypothetical protein